MTHGSKTLELDISDQSVTKIVDASNIVGSNAVVIADELADQVAKFHVTSGGSGYSNDDIVEVSGAGGSGGAPCGKGEDSTFSPELNTITSTIIRLVVAFQ